MKKNILAILIWLSLLTSFTSCSVEPKEIKYGNDHCFNCDMTVVDKTHAAQYVTKKGKAYVFDAVECLMMKLEKDKNEELMAFVLVADFNNPGTLIDAKTATYLISEKIKSPMGANLSAFSSPEITNKFLKENGGEIFSWEQLKLKYSK